MTDTTSPSDTTAHEAAGPESGAGTRFRLLGPMEVVHKGVVCEVPPGRQQAVLAALLLRPGEVVSAPTLVEQVWGDSADRSVLNVCVMRLRRSLHDHDHDLIRAENNGYRVAVDPQAVDLHRFRLLREQARRARDQGDPQRERDALREALGLWHGDALAGVVLPVLQSDVVLILEEERLAAIEGRVDADLDCGAHAEVIPELRRLVADHPFRERFWCQLLLALYRSGRQSEALDAYRSARRRLTEELGIEPGDELRELHQRILGSDPALVARPPDPKPVSPVIPAQLPAGVAGFTGRTDQLRQLDRLLDRGEPEPTTLIIGPPGVGKTALAAHWAGRHREWWPDGQLYVDLRGYGPEAVVRPLEALASFLRAIGLPAEQVPKQLAEASALFRSLTADRRLLVLLDNASATEQVRPLLPGGTGCTVIVTSRDRLRGLVVKEGARQLSLDVMGDAEARSLLANAVGDARLAAEPDSLGELVRLCGNLPLALRITAADLIDHPRRSLAEHLTELRTRNRLDVLQAADDEEGTAVRTAFRSSYTRLPEPEQRLFRLLGLFPGPEVTARTTAALADIDPAAASRLLDRLVSAHLVTSRGPDRYGLHDLLRLFAAELARDRHDVGERDAVIRRLYDHYAHTAGAASKRIFSYVVLLPLPKDVERAPVNFDGDTDASQWLESERANLVALIRYAMERGDHLDVCRLAVATQSYLHTTLHTVDWLTTARCALHAARAIGHWRAQILTHLNLANLHRLWSQRDAAMKHFQKALVLCRHDGWTEGQSTVHNNISGIHDQEGNLRQTAVHLRQALDLRGAIAGTTGEAIILGNLGRVLLRLGQVEDAIVHLERATSVHHRLGARLSEARSRASLGEALSALGEHERALALLSDATAVQRELDDRMYLPTTLGRFASAHLEVGERARADELATAGLALARETGNRRSLPRMSYVLARVDEQAGRYDSALELYREACRLSLDVGNRYAHVQAMIGMGTVHRRLGHPAEARRLLDTAVATARRFEYALLERQAAAAAGGGP